MKEHVVMYSINVIAICLTVAYVVTVTTVALNYLLISVRRLVNEVVGELGNLQVEKHVSVKVDNEITH